MNPTPEQLNVVLCEWLGWTEIFNGSGYHPEQSAKLAELHNGGKWHSPLPNHLSPTLGLSLLHEAEKRLTREQVTQYVTELRGFQAPENWEGCWGISADCLTRLTALVRVVKPEVFQ